MKLKTIFEKLRDAYKRTVNDRLEIEQPEESTVDFKKNQVRIGEKERVCTTRKCLEIGDFNGTTQCLRYSKRRLIKSEELVDQEKPEEPTKELIEEPIKTQGKVGEQDRFYTVRECLEIGDFDGKKRCLRYSKRRRIKPTKTRIVSKKKRLPTNVSISKKSEDLEVFDKPKQLETEITDKTCTGKKTYTKRKCLEWKTVNGRKVCIRYSKRRLICSGKQDPQPQQTKDVKQEEEVQTSPDIVEDVKQPSKPKMGIFKFLSDYVF